MPPVSSFELLPDSQRKTPAFLFCELYRKDGRRLFPARFYAKPSAGKGVSIFPCDPIRFPYHVDDQIAQIC